MPDKILVLFAHPLYERSRVNKALIKTIRRFNITFHDLYEEYPDFNIHIDHEKKLLMHHDIIIWHHPLYWYSCPPLLKQWIDMVLEVGWAYGHGGNALRGKKIMQIITTGGPKSAYREIGNNRYTIRQFLAPFEQTAQLCQLHYLPPFVTHGTHRLTDDEIQHQVLQLKKLMEILEKDGAGFDEFNKYQYINDYLTDLN